MKFNIIVIMVLGISMATPSYSSDQKPENIILDANGVQATSALDCVLACFDDINDKELTYIVFPRKSDIDIYIDWKNTERKWITFEYAKNSVLFDVFHRLKLLFKDNFKYTRINNDVLVSFKAPYFTKKTPVKIAVLEPFENIVIKKINLPVTKTRKVKEQIPKDLIDYANMLSPDEAREEIAQLRKKYDNFPEEYYVFWSELAKLATKNDPFKRKITIRIEKKELNDYFPFVLGEKVSFKRLLEILSSTMNFKCAVKDNVIILK